MLTIEQMTSKRWLLASLGIFTLLIAVSSITFVRAKNRSIPLSGAIEEAVVVNDRSVPSLPDDIELPDNTTSTKSLSSANKVNVLLLGYGGAGHQGGFLTDVIVVAHFDVAAKKLAFIHIPRDIWVDIPVGSSVLPTKINAALALGTKSGNYPVNDLKKDTVLRGSHLSKVAVKQITGLDIDYVIGVDFNGFKQAIDKINGIDVNVATTLSDPWYPVTGRELELCGHSPEDVTAMTATMSGFNLEKQFPCRYEQLVFHQGINHMDGNLALKFVRSRHTSSDFARGERQIEVLSAVKDKLLKLNTLSHIPEFFKSIANSIKTDLTAAMITDFSPTLSELSGYKIIHIGLSTTNVLSSGTAKTGASILLPKSGNWQETQQYINGQFFR